MGQDSLADTRADRNVHDTEPHRSTIQLVDHLCSEASFVDWEQDSSDLPDWQTCWRRLVADGRSATLSNASDANETGAGAGAARLGPRNRRVALGAEDRLSSFRRSFLPVRQPNVPQSCAEFAKSCRTRGAAKPDGHPQSATNTPARAAQISSSCSSSNAGIVLRELAALCARPCVHSRCIPRPQRSTCTTGDLGAGRLLRCALGVF